MYETGNWKIEIDLEGTKQYYEKLKITPSNLEAWINYCMYLECMNPKEKKLFEKFGILPYKCDVASDGLSSVGYSTYGAYLIKGKYLKMPTQEGEVSILSLKESIFQVGMFDFKFVQSIEGYASGMVEIPEGFICLEFEVRKLLWLLEGTPQNIVPEDVNWLHPVRKIKAEKIQKQLEIQEKQEILQEIIWDLKTQNIPFRIMNKKQVNKLKECWFYTFIPEENRKKAKMVCFPKGGYLWHLFSYKYAKCLEKEKALSAYLKCNKTDCYLYFSYTDIGIKIRNADKFVWEKKDIYEDFLITEKDFFWTFAKTHEEQCGPYFKKDADFADTLHFI